MNSTNKSIEAVSQNNFIKILKGSIISIIITLIMLFIFALLLAYTDMRETIITPVIICTSGISILVGSMISSKNIRKQGLINGGLVGLIYITIIYLLSSIVQGNFGLNASSIIMIATSILAGALGGIVGVNLRSRK